MTSLFSQILIEYFADQSLGELLPFLPDEAEIQTIKELSTRSKNALQRMNCATISHISFLSIRDIQQGRNVGKGTVENIVSVLVRVNASHPRPEAFRRFSVGKRNRSRVLEAMNVIAAWNAENGCADDPLLAPLITKIAIAPESVLSAYSELTRIRSRDLLDEGGSIVEVGKHQEPVDVIEMFLRGLSDRDRSILMNRMLSKTPSTFQAISEELGLSRERVRQIQREIQQRLRSLVKENESLYQLWHESVNGQPKVIQYEKLLQSHMELCGEIFDGFIVFSFLQAIPGYWKRLNSWAVRGDPEELIRHTKEQLNSALKTGNPSLENIAFDLTGLCWPEDVAEWIVYCGFKIESDTVIKPEL